MALLDDGWVWPYWLERQLDAAGADFQPLAPGAEATNVTHRNWTLVGNLASWHRATVDPRGLVTPWDGAWSLDWWVGAEDRWHLPSREGAVRQRLVDGAPVVETLLRVPGGEIVQRVYAVVEPSGGRDGGYVVVELTNASAVPVAVALAVRPYHPLGWAPVHSVALEGSTVVVDGRPGVLLARPPARSAASTGDDGDCAEVVLRGDAGQEAAAASCARGRAQLTCIFPLAHTAVLRAALPLEAPRAPRRRGDRPATPMLPSVLPDAAQVARGWVTQTGRGLRVSLPDRRLGEALVANRGHLLVAHAGEDLVSRPARPFDVAEAAWILAALGEQGFADEVEEVLGTWPERQGLDGAVHGQEGRLDANGAALAAVARHWQLTRDDALFDELVGPMAKAAHWIEKRRSGRRVRRDQQPGGEVVGRGLLPAGRGPDWAGPSGVYFRDLAWAWRGLQASVGVFEAAGQPEVAEDVGRFAARAREDLEAAVRATAARHGGIIPAGPSRRPDGGLVAVVDLLSPVGPWAVDDPVVAPTVERVRVAHSAGAAVVAGAGPAGWSPALTLQLALAELEAGDDRAMERVAWLLEVATPTWTWPSAIHPRSRGGSAGDGHAGLVAALYCLFVRRLLVRETDDGLALCSVVPADWYGQGIEVHDAPTSWGRCSFAVRWHGERPALLWELDPHDDVGPVRLCAPGLDPGWSSLAPRGETLLAVPPAASPAASPAAGDSFG
ncbi:MAG: hypothetical protein MUF83_09870 [Acidimicrobiales bacterium]|jgi:hypothetical protein|nr:hypothetical protein [Acidimicrobiales bacterium]